MSSSSSQAATAITNRMPTCVWCGVVWCGVEMPQRQLIASSCDVQHRPASGPHKRPPHKQCIEQHSTTTPPPRRASTHCPVQVLNSACLLTGVVPGMSVLSQNSVLAARSMRHAVGRFWNPISLFKPWLWLATAFSHRSCRMHSDSYAAYAIDCTRPTGPGA